MFERIWKKILRRDRLSIWTIPAFILWLISICYRAGFYLVRLFAAQPTKLSVPVISIGNISVGGTGKTPLVLFLAKALSAEGLKVGVVSSAYGRDGDQSIVEDGYKLLKRPASEIGDEVLFLAEALPNVLFSIDKIKLHAAQNLEKRKEVDLILVDDGFQHAKLARDIDLVTYDAGVKSRHLKLFPYGVLREPITALSRADIVIITRSNFARDITSLLTRIKKFSPDSSVYHAQFVANQIIGRERNLPIKYLEDKSIILFAGIGNFEAFRKQVNAYAVDIDLAFEFSDHQKYDLETLEKIKRAADQNDSDLILTTGKDWVKLKDYDFGRDIYYLDQQIDLDPGEEKLVKEVLARLKKLEH